MRWCSLRPIPAPCWSSGSALTASNLFAIQLRLMEPDRQPRCRHVWVDGGGGSRGPGLVIAWRRTDDGWEAYVATARESSVLVTWEKASSLHPVRDDGWSTSAPASWSRRPRQ